MTARRAGKAARRFTVALTIGVTLVAAAPAQGERFVAQLRLTSARPNTPTGGSLHVIWPKGPSGKPKPEATGIFRLPAGTHVNENAVPACTATDAQIQLEGASACPPSSYLGPGEASVLTGLGPPIDPFWLEDSWYRGLHQIVGVFTARDTTAPVIKINRVEIHGATFIARLSLPPGYPPGTKTAPRTTDQIIRKRVGANGSFITTPPMCPKSGRWIAHATTIYDDGTSDSAKTVMRCKRARRGG